METIGRQQKHTQLPSLQIVNIRILPVTTRRGYIDGDPSQISALTLNTAFYDILTLDFVSMVMWAIQNVCPQANNVLNIYKYPPSKGKKRVYI